MDGEVSKVMELKTKIFHTTNEGLLFLTEKASLLVDGVHRGRAEGCSPMPESLALQADAGTGMFAGLGGMLFTHLHGDHFDPERVARIMSGEAPPRLIGACFDKASGDCRMISGEAFAAELDGINIRMFKTTHDGKVFSSVPHYSVILEAGGQSYFIAGDAVLNDAVWEAFEKNGGNRHFQAVFVNPMQLLPQSGIDFTGRIDTDHIYMYHLPFPEDDVFSYWEIARSILRKSLAELPNLEVIENMQWITG